jgi:uncharacterized integral membrane protein
MDMQKVRLSLAVILVVLVFVLIIQNQEMVVTKIFLWSPEMPRFVLLGGTFLAGGFAGYMVGRGTRIGPKKDKEEG